MIEKRKYLPLHLYVRVLGGLMLIYITYQVHTTIDNFPMWLLLLSYFIFGFGSVVAFIRLFQERSTSEKIEESKNAKKSLKVRIIQNILWSIPAIIMSVYLLYQKGETHLVDHTLWIKLLAGWFAALIIITFIQHIYWTNRNRELY